MNSNKILELYNEVCKLKRTDLYSVVENRLDLILNRYMEQLDESFDELQKYDYLDIVKEVNKNAKFE